MQEIWKDVVGFEDRFQISNLGNIYSKKNKKQLVQGTSKTGYKVLSTRIGGKNGIYKCFKVHRLVAQAFIPNPENKPFVNHIDGNKLNNHVNNLEWCTNQENIKHAYDTGLLDLTHLQEFNKKARKLTKEEVYFVRKHYTPRHKEYGARALGRKYNVDKNTILDILSFKAYKDI